MITINIKTTKKCALCKYWYDPANTAISPKNPKHNLWKIEDESKRMCLKRNYDMPATAFCNQYDCKL